MYVVRSEGSTATLTLSSLREQSWQARMGLNSLSTDEGRQRTSFILSEQR